MPKDPIAEVVTKLGPQGKWVKIGALWHHNTDNRTGIKLLAIPTAGKAWAWPKMPPNVQHPFLQGDLMAKLEEGSDYRTRVGFITTADNAEGGEVVYTMTFDAFPLRSPVWLEVSS